MNSFFMVKSESTVKSRIQIPLTRSQSKTSTEPQKRQYMLLSPHISLEEILPTDVHQGETKTTHRFVRELVNLLVRYYGLDMVSLCPPKDRVLKAWSSA